MTTEGTPEYARETELLEEKKTLTARISEGVRFIAFGFLATFYTVYTDDKGFGKLLAEQPCSRAALFVVGICGATAILFDYLQYLAGASSVKQALASNDKYFDRSTFAYRARAFFYNAKQIPILLGCAALIAFVLST
jgi:hypothetical protein